MRIIDPLLSAVLVAAVLLAAAAPAISATSSDDSGKAPLTANQALTEAALRGDIETIQTLIQTQRADPNYSDAGGMTPVLAAYTSRKYAALEVLVRQGATCKMLPVYAAYSPDPEAMQVALNCGGDPNAQEANGNTPLHILARRSHKDSGWTDDAVTMRVQQLLGRRADLLALDKNGRTPLRLALVLRNYRAATALSSSGKLPIEELFADYKYMEQHKPEAAAADDYRVMMAAMNAALSTRPPLSR